MPQIVVTEENFGATLDYIKYTGSSFMIENDDYWHEITYYKDTEDYLLQTGSSLCCFFEDRIKNLSWDDFVSHLRCYCCIDRYYYTHNNIHYHLVKDDGSIVVCDDLDEAEKKGKEYKLINPNGKGIISITRTIIECIPI